MTGDLWAGPAGAWNRYQLQEQLDDRGQVHVYRGTDGTTGEQVAVRVHVGDALRVDQVEARWQQQKAIIRRVLTAVDGGIQDIDAVFRGARPHAAGDPSPRGEVTYAVSPWVVGTTLFDCHVGVPAAGAEDLRERLAVLARVVAVLCELQNLGQRHGDVKPSNILVTGPSDAMLLDPDTLAPAAAPLTEFTVGYADPHHPERADLHGLAACVYFLATGDRDLPNVPGAAVQRLSASGGPRLAELYRQATTGGDGTSGLGGTCLVGAWYDAVVAALSTQPVVVQPSDRPTESPPATEHLAPPTARPDAATPAAGAAVPPRHPRRQPPTERVQPGWKSQLANQLADESAFLRWQRVVAAVGFLIPVVIALLLVPFVV